LGDANYIYNFVTFLIKITGRRKRKEEEEEEEEIGRIEGTLGTKTHKAQDKSYSLCGKLLTEFNCTTV
jgi:hypothetical protein